MSLLERFGIVFDSNATDVTKDNEKLAESFDDVEKSAKKATDGTQENTKAVDAGNKSLAKKSITLGALTRRFLGIAAAIKIATMALEGLNKTTSVGRLAEDLGVSVKEFEKFALTSERLGGSASATRSSIAELVTSIEGLSIGQNLDLFEKLQFAGASVFDEGGNKKDVFQILGEISDFFQTLTPERALQRGQNAGLDIGLIRTLRGDMDEELRITEELGVITREQTDAAQKLAETMNKVGQIWDTIVRESLHPLVPALDTLASNFLEFSKELRSAFSFFRDDPDTSVVGFGEFLFDEGVDYLGDLFSKVGISGESKDEQLIRDQYPFDKDSTPEEEEKRKAELRKKLGEFYLERSRKSHQENVVDPYNRRQELLEKRRLQRSGGAANSDGAPGAPALGPAASSAAITNNNQQASSSVHIDQINIDAANNANAADIGANVGSEIQTSIAAVNAQYSSGVLA